MLVILCPLACKKPSCIFLGNEKIYMDMLYSMSSKKCRQHMLVPQAVSLWAKENIFHVTCSFLKAPMNFPSSFVTLKFFETLKRITTPRKKSRDNGKQHHLFHITQTSTQTVGLFHCHSLVFWILPLSLKEIHDQ